MSGLIEGEESEFDSVETAAPPKYWLAPFRKSYFATSSLGSVDFGVSGFNMVLHPLGRANT
jgi:hypothetical protein